MAPWIEHLRLAEYLLQEIHALDAHYFAIGNVAPDSGIRDDITKEFNPPSRVSHFFAPKGARYHVADLDFYRTNLSEASPDEMSDDRFSFLLGYYFHLVTDNLWYQQIDLPTREKFHAQFEADPEFIWEVKRDWYGLDLDFVRSNPESLYWSIFLNAEYESDFLNFVPKHAIQRRVDEIRELYQRTDDDIEEWYGRRPDKYLSKQKYDQFIEENRPRLFEAFKVLFEGNRSISQHLSILEIV